MGLISVILLLVLGFSTPRFLTGLDSLKLTQNLQASLFDISLANAFDSQELNNDSNLGVGLTKNSPVESPELLFVQKNSLIAVSPPNMITPQTLGSLVGDSNDEFWGSRREIIEYTVQSGDTLAGLAEKFNISLETILWVNNLNKNSKIKPGQSLIILPVSGVLYYVNEKDTLSGIAKTYKSETSKIIAFNELSNENDIYIGDILIIPDGKIPPKQQIATLPTSSSQTPLASSYFITPISSPYIITQRLHWYNAIDFSYKDNACGKPVFVVAGGTVQRTGYDRTAGNYVRILHPNGVITFYGHLNSILVFQGQSVSQGGIIGYIGKTGYSTGCHLHFEVRGARNPFAK